RFGQPSLDLPKQRLSCRPEMERMQDERSDGVRLRIAKSDHRLKIEPRCRRGRNQPDFDDVLSRQLYGCPFASIAEPAFFKLQQTNVAKAIAAEYAGSFTGSEAGQRSVRAQLPLQPPRSPGVAAGHHGLGNRFRDCAPQGKSHKIARRTGARSE